ncbi:hypothetical protein AYO44_11910 [Planctomycetaceae bacterium SCGC AG-212-F19]|nr:hypothetical protein AYO44_11910 [Planctomycetaceae bacterium SCGC AG-212-F19]
MNDLFCRRWLRGFWLILAVLAGVVFVFRLDAMVRQGPYYVTTGFEDISIYNISQIRYGAPVYTDCFEYPYRASLFNWLFYLIHGSAATLLNPSEEALPTCLRLVTLAWTLAGFGVTLWLLRGGDTITTLALAFVAWFGPLIGWWSMTVRPDVPALVCEMLGLTLIVRGDSRLSAGRAVAAGVAFFLAWSFKQSAIGIFAGSMLALLLRREWFNLGVVAGMFVALTGLVLLLASPAYYLNMFVAPSLASFEMRQLHVVLFWVRALWGPVIVLALLLFLALPRPARGQLVQARPVGIATVVLGVVLVLNVLAARRPGGSPNYFFESWLIGMSLVGMVQQTAANEPKAFAAPLPRLLLIAGPLFLLVYCVHWTLPIFDPLDKPATQPVEIMLRLPRAPYPPELLEAVRTSPRPILCDDTFLLRQALGAETAGLPVVDHTIYWDASRAGRLAHPDVQERIQNREYVNIWLDTGRSDWDWEPFVLKAGYVLLKDDGTLRQYTRPPTASRP